MWIWNNFPSYQLHFWKILILIGTHFDSFVHTYTLFGKDLKRKEAPYFKRETTITQLLVSIRTHVLGEILPLAFGPTQKYHLTPRHAPKPSNLIWKSWQFFKCRQKSREFTTFSYYIVHKPLLTCYNLTRKSNPFKMILQCSADSQK